jgi:hypothetical protein
MRPEPPGLPSCHPLLLTTRTNPGTAGGEMLPPGARDMCYALFGSIYSGERYDWVAESGCAAKDGSPFAVLLLRGTRETCRKRDRCMQPLQP